MQTPESILVASSKALAAMRQTDPQHYKALRDYIGTSEQTILAMARPEFDVAYRQQKEFVKGLDGIAKKSVELYNDWVAATMHFKEALELISGPFMTAMDSAIKAADAWLTETRPAIEAFANSTARTVADIITKLGSIPFGRIANELFDGLQKGLAKINFDNVKTVLHEFMNWLVTGPLANAIIELVRRVGAASSGFLGAIGQTLAPGMGRVQAPGAPGSGGRFGHAGSYAGRASNDAATGDGRAITGVGTAASLTPAAGREGQITGVDKRLMDSLAAGAAHLPAGFALYGGPYHFFPRSSRRAEASSIDSASSFFSLPFSSSSARSRLASETSIPPNLAFQLYSVASDIPYFRQSSPAFAPASCSRNTAMICSSVNLLRFIGPSLVQAGL